MGTKYSNKNHKHTTALLLVCLSIQTVFYNQIIKSSVPLDTFTSACAAKF